MRCNFPNVDTKDPEDTPSSGEWVFVYGTLRRGGSNAFRMEGARFISTAKVEGALYAISWYPGLIRGKDFGYVIGEVYQVGPEQMRALDEFEGLSAGEIEGSEYRRVKVPVFLDGIPFEGRRLAWAYEWKGPVDDEKRIGSGDWLDVVQPRPPALFTWIAVGAAAGGVLNLAGLLLAEISLLLSIHRPLLELMQATLYVFPLVGIASASFADRRREDFAILRRILVGACTIWLLGLLFVTILVVVS